jgi:RNA polymerase subunit RPABC4/transcription elongation factor Spt4
MRAEALHDFIQWIKDCKLNSTNLAAKNAAKKWNKISYFLIGCNAVQGANGEGFICNTIDATCCGWLMDWKNERANCVKEFVRGIYRYREDFINNLLGVNDYSPVDDIVWQLKGDNNFRMMNAEDGLAFFRSLGGCNIPEISNAVICLNSRHKWRSLEERLKWKLWLLADANDGMIQDDQMVDNVAHNGGTLTLSQAKVLWGSTIDVLSDACVLPRYGFPVDTISLITDRDDGDAYGIELSRPIHLGMYEYAPRQSVYANKRRYESRGAKVYRFNNGDANLVANANGTVLKYCDSCHKVFYHGEEMCPCCQGQTKNQTFVTPELFIARRGSINPPREYSPRQRLVSWGGQVRQQSMCPVSGMSLTVAEPTERVVNYVNTNIRDKEWFYLCEVPTNVVLWIPGFMNSHQAFNGWEGNRIANAFTSAMYALRKSMSGVLNVNERDIGALIQAYHSGNDNSFWFVFFDADNGGGSGCVLDLLVRNVHDINGMTRIRDIVQSAIAILEDCCCGAQHDNAYADLMPVPISDYNPNNTQRPVQSCYHCLRNYDNQFEHDKLDKYDAIKVLRLLLEDSSNGHNLASQEPIVTRRAVVTENMVEQDAEFDENADSWEIGGVLFRRITEDECKNLQNNSFCLFKTNQAPGYRIGYLRSGVDRNAILGVKR